MFLLEMMKFFFQLIVLKDSYFEHLSFVKQDFELILFLIRNSERQGTEKRKSPIQTNEISFFTKMNPCF